MIPLRAVEVMCPAVARFSGLLTNTRCGIGRQLSGDGSAWINSLCEDLADYSTARTVRGQVARQYTDGK
jgi:hypothetical protein